MTLHRVLVTTSVTLTHVFTIDQIPTDATGDVTATLTRHDGTQVSTGTATRTDVGTYAYTLPAQTQLDWLRLSWSGVLSGVTVTHADYVEIVGGRLFSIARAFADLRLDPNKYSASDIAEKRVGVEDEIEGICKQAFVPRFAVEKLPGSDSPRLRLKWNTLRTVRAASLAGTALTAGQLAAISVSAHGIVTRTDGALWAPGPVVIEYEHGMDEAPEIAAEAGIILLQHKLGRTNSGVPSRTLSVSTPDGGTIRFSTASRQRTGIPDVDGILEKLSRGPRSVIA